MELINEKLKKIIAYLGDPSKSDIAGDKLVCYLTFPVEKCLEVKKNLPNCIKILEHHNYKPGIVSIAEIVCDFFKNHENKNIWLDTENCETKEEYYELFRDLGSTLKNNKVIENYLCDKIKVMPENSENILIITDLDALHPFTRFGPIEQELYSSFNLPVLIFYPGTISGSALKFLDIYPEDGNYRSKHF